MKRGFLTLLLLSIATITSTYAYNCKEDCIEAYKECTMTKKDGAFDSSCVKIQDTCNKM